ncbi:tRNA (adenosine(37)-N6)-threonylcarbamoyltransferase complex ATPase subunit type 1 TsaE [Nakamurella sp. YIM 132087]|uniref:tRNA threonylcarbamoyladenosine biosynthesis protein TsaE n=1 Tax=Nakamurella alba TaxID=2665158 RepID=A0A7K1FM00_9ACTN|nr:tRNA (adenosine(37)-N6)-threonylcarbamoyltransferase complex ATPase subunit type 1 TsaE [Nakamurella alba]MTD14349.1 tRNA (adenosine(37)-N6)-threonylcarbamoyltransferase complex ATPase subunit type 1 TsaE [Nakamurella alba]
MTTAEERPVLHRELPTEADARELGRRIGELLRAGDLVLLSGPLGAGKTTMAKGIAVGMGITSTIMSPTFVIVRVHRPTDPGGLTLLHADAYRLGSVAEMDDLDLDLGAAAAVVEWGDGVAEQIADGHLRVELVRRPDDSRGATLSAAGSDWEERLQTLRD